MATAMTRDPTIEAINDLWKMQVFTQLEPEFIHQTLNFTPLVLNSGNILTMTCGGDTITN
jgi:hypothetical protein